MGPGDIVVCVNNGFIMGAGNSDAVSRLNIGDVYTIRQVAKFEVRGSFGVKLWEVITHDDWWWHPARFRPCRKTNIDNLETLAERARSQFEHMEQGV